MLTDASSVVVRAGVRAGVCANLASRWRWQYWPLDAMQPPDEYLNTQGKNVMQVLSSLKSAKARHPDCQVVKRRGRTYVICKSNPRFKAVQGKKKKR